MCFSLQWTHWREQRGTTYIVAHVTNDYPAQTETSPPSSSCVTVLLVQHLLCCGFLIPQPPPPIFQQSLKLSRRRHMVCCTQHMVSVMTELRSSFLSHGVYNMWRVKRVEILNSKPILHAVTWKLFECIRLYLVMCLSMSVCVSCDSEEVGKRWDLEV